MRRSFVPYNRVEVKPDDILQFQNLSSSQGLSSQGLSSARLAQRLNDQIRQQRWLRQSTQQPKLDSLDEKVFVQPNTRLQKPQTNQSKRFVLNTEPQKPVKKRQSSAGIRPEIHVYTPNYRRFQILQETNSQFKGKSLLDLQQRCPHLNSNDQILMIKKLHGMADAWDESSFKWLEKLVFSIYAPVVNRRLCVSKEEKQVVSVKLQTCLKQLGMSSADLSKFQQAIQQPPQLSVIQQLCIQDFVNADTNGDNLLQKDELIHQFPIINELLLSVIYDLFHHQDSSGIDQEHFQQLHPLLIALMKECKLDDENTVEAQQSIESPNGFQVIDQNEDINFGQNQDSQQQKDTSQQLDKLFITHSSVSQQLVKQLYDQYSSHKNYDGSTDDLGLLNSLLSYLVSEVKSHEPQVLYQQLEPQVTFQQPEYETINEQLLSCLNGLSLDLQLQPSSPPIDIKPLLKALVSMPALNAIQQLNMQEFMEADTNQDGLLQFNEVVSHYSSFDSTLVQNLFDFFEADGLSQEQFAQLSQIFVMMRGKPLDHGYVSHRCPNLVKQGVFEDIFKLGGEIDWSQLYHLSQLDALI